MGTIKSLNKWANAHTYYPLDLLRVALGVFLFIKGVNFMGNTAMLLDIIKPLQSVTGEMFVIHYIAPAHFVGGILIAFGLLTRWAIVAQLPILIGAVVINFVGDFSSNNLVLATVALALSLFFLVYGSGKHSVDKYLRMQK